MSKRENVTLASALAALFSGIAMCFCSFFLSEAHEIADSALFYLGEMLVYAGSLLGVKNYIDYKIGKP